MFLHGSQQVSKSHKIAFFEALIRDSQTTVDFTVQVCQQKCLCPFNLLGSLACNICNCGLCAHHCCCVCNCPAPQGHHFFSPHTAMNPYKRSCPDAQTATFWQQAPQKLMWLPCRLLGDPALTLTLQTLMTASPRLVYYPRVWVCARMVVLLPPCRWQVYFCGSAYSASCAQLPPTNNLDARVLLCKHAWASLQACTGGLSCL